MKTDNIVSRAIVFATFYHNGQTRKFGVNEPFIFHPLRVMMKMKTDEERVVAMLHDVLEDTNATVSDLRKEFPHDQIIFPVVALTRTSGEVYASYIGRVMKNPLAVRVKREDVIDNMTNPGIPESLQMRYVKTLERLKGK